ncbi:alanine racemase [Prolixibacter denitrificans]|uniref:Diaminopimelate decarboxylase n=1 Tax=Prolixibacter denitrificans TaxID=1541063 RepID=A0A2P8CL34_9BACT|nr:diaminopimelate decarboxylase [Prolixibacter denitrificans]PSK85633.1 diaminopimelate decarboxylase [Prolixibacter denitrificans]GET20253.1 diaminopimelate decarboxylase [Prolixibacter denitrificans]
MAKLAYERPIINRISAGIPDKFGMQSRIRPIPQIEGLSVEELMKKYGSPLFVLSEKTIRDTYRSALKAFETRYPSVQFAWSYKTNYLDSVCRIFHQEGSWAEVVSRFEYEKALSNGVPGNQIIFNGPHKTRDDLEVAIENDSLIHIDHFDELYTLLEIAGKSATKPKVAIRVNMDTGIYPRWERFGFNYENGEAWDALNRIMLSGKLDLVGLHTHIGTYILAPSAYGMAANKLAQLAINLARKYNHHVQYIDMGGGFASKNTLKGAYLPGTDTCPTFDEYADAITSALINSEIEPDHMPTLFLETGRALIDDAGYLLGTVIANKRLPDGRRATVVDAGVNLLFTSFWYDHQVVPAVISSQHTENTTIYGPLCMNIDILRDAVMFPLLRPGERIVIPRVGAYNMTQWLQFITYRPNIVLIDTEQRVHVIREQENQNTFQTSERIPQYLK